MVEAQLRCFLFCCFFFLFSYMYYVLGTGHVVLYYHTSIVAGAYKSESLWHSTFMLVKSAPDPRGHVVAPKFDYLQ